MAKVELNTKINNTTVSGNNSKSNFQKLQDFARLNNIDLSKFGINESTNEEVCSRVLELLKTGNTDSDKIFNVVSKQNLNETSNVNNNIKSYNSSKAKVELICKEYNIDVNYLKEEYYENFLKSVDYVKTKINEGEFKNFSKDDIGKTILKYTVALNYQWDTIEDYVHYSENDSDSFINRLVKNNLLKKKKDCSMYSQDELTQACKKYFNDTFTNIAKQKIKENKLKPEEVNEWVNKLFNQTYGKLLINTVDKKELDLVLPIINRVKEDMVNDAVSNIMTLTSNNSELQSQIATKIVSNIECLSRMSEDTAARTAGAISGKDLSNALNTNTSELIEISVQYPNLINNSNKKAEEDYTPEETRLDNTTVVRSILIQKASETEEGAIIAAESDKKLQEEGSEALYKYVQKKTDEYIKNYVPEEERERLVKFFNTISNGNFSKVLENYDCKLNPPVDIKTLSQGAQDDLGLKIPDKSVVDAAQNKTSELNKVIFEQTVQAEQVQQPQDTTKVSPVEKVAGFFEGKNFDITTGIFDTKEYANNTFKAVKAVFTGKVKVASQDENKALDKYKVLNSAEQKFVLESAKNSWLREIINNTKDSVVLAFTGVGANSYATKEIEDAKRNVEKK